MFSRFKSFFKKTEIPEKFKHDYLKELERLNIKGVKILCSLGALLMPVSLFWDWIICPEYLSTFFWLRMTMTLVMLIFLLCLCFLPSIEKKWESLCMITLLTAGGGLCIMIHILGADHPYYATLILVYLVAMIMPWRFEMVVTSSLLIFSFYLIPSFFLNLGNRDLIAYIINIGFQLEVILISSIVSYFQVDRRINDIINRLRISEQKEELSKSYETIKINENVKKEFYSNITHELKTPLSIMTGHAELLEERLEEMGVAVEQTAYVLDSANHLGRLIDRIISFSLLEKDAPLKLENIEYSSLVMKTFNLFQDKAKEENLEYTIEKMVPWAVVRVDVTRTEEVLHNLIQNAFKYTLSGGKIQITVFEKNKKIYTDITDTGVGIPKDKMERLFQRWSQMDNVLSKKHGGVGLGLYICKKNIELHDGSIDVISEEGKGTTFRIALPLYIDQNAKVRNITHPETERRGESRRRTERRNVERRSEERLKRFEYQKERTLKNSMAMNLDLSIYENQKTDKPTVLVLEDTDALMMIMIEALREDYNLLFGRNGEEGLEKLHGHQEKIELILSDVMMSGMSGFEFAKKMMDEERYKHIPLIFISALHDEQHILKGIHLGATDYIAKPISLKVLKEKVIHWISRRKYELFLQEISNSLENKVNETNKLRSILTHEIRNPLQIISAMKHYVHRLKESFYGQSSDEEKIWWDRVDKSGMGVDTLKNVLEASKELEKSASEFQSESLKKIIEESYAQTVHFLGDCIFSLDLGEQEKKHVRCSKQLLVQVLVNLIRNAKEAILEKKLQELGKIHITCEQINDFLMLHVSDNGVGISPELQAKIFQFKFTTKRDGTGIGLHFSKLILKLMGGNITIQSQERMGTTFSIQLVIG
jgi:signal transduction histidine kinase